MSTVINGANTWSDIFIPGYVYTPCIFFDEKWPFRQKNGELPVNTHVKPGPLYTRQVLMLA